MPIIDNTNASAKAHHHHHHPNPDSTLQRSTATGEAPTARRGGDESPIGATSRAIAIHNAKLDGHAGAAHIHASAQTGEGKDRGKGPWDAWARYKSDEHSFPDYGTRNARMASSGAAHRLKSINGSTGPVNTLNSPLPPWRRPPGGQLVNDGGAAKSQRLDGRRPHRPSTSPYFTPSKPHAPDDAPDVIRSSPHDEPCDLRSLSSAGNTSSTANAMSSAAMQVAEFRYVQQNAASGSRPRRRKPRHCNSPEAAKRTLAVKDPSFATETPARDARPAGLESPDDLAKDDNPPPANVASDVRSQLPAKRGRQPDPSESTGPPVKRRQNRSPMETIESSGPDELSVGHSQPAKHLTNFSHISGTRSSARNRADIQPAFGEQRRSSPSKLSDMILKRAACGRSYLSDDQHGCVVLRPEPSNSGKLVPTVKDERVELPWLQIDIEKITTLRHDSRRSSYVAIHRPSSAPGDGRLFLEFTNRQGAMAIVSRAGAEKAKKDPTSDFDRVMQKTINDAVDFAEKNRSAKRDVRQLAEAQPDEMPWSAVGFTVEPDKDSGPKREKLMDKMQRTARAADSQPIDLRGHGKRPLRSAHELPRARRSSPTLPGCQQELPDLWTGKNPGWRQLWKTSLVFPATGKNRTTVDADDIPRLDEGEFLNDNLINFYLRYLQVELENHRPELLKKVHIFSTFFFEKLRSTKGKINYDGVKAWTAKFDLFTYDYIVVPVNERAHWYLAIICNAPNALSGIPAGAADVEVIDMSQDHPAPEVVSSPPSTATRTIEATSPNAGSRTSTGGGPQKYDPRLPKIVTLDSLGSQHSPTCRALKEYLAEEAKSKKGIGLAVAPNGMTAKEIPEQDNFCDCGVFVLGYMEEFLKDPDQAARKLLQKESLGWDVQPSKLRDNVRTLLFQLQEVQQARLEREQKEKKMKRKSMAKRKPEDKAKVPSSQTAEASSSSPQASAEERPTDTLMGPSTNEGENNGQPAEGPSPPKSSGPPKGTLQSCDDEAEFVSSLKSDSSRSANTPNDVFYSAPSSPDGKPPGDGARLAGQSANGKRAGKAQQAGKPASCSKEPQFVATLPSSSPPLDSAAGVEAPKKQRQREPSVELVNRNRSTGMVPSREGKQSGPVPSVTRPFLSVEIPSAGGRRAGYDGVDRSADQAVDLT